MKAKLLKKLRKIGRNKITILSITTTWSESGPYTTGMKYSYTEPEYADLFGMFDTEEDVRNRAMRIFLNKNIDEIRRKYKRYSRLYKVNYMKGE